ncbi:MAG: hypothetical protein M1502_01675 [Deltaproteobacteria bacterium]|nr:hypothetical protein [Deltaproteobacteria bacterium]
MLENTNAKSEEKPLFLLLAGSNGAGKSTYIKSEHFKDVLNVLQKSVQEIEKSINKYFNLCKSFAIETVLSTDK